MPIRMLIKQWTATCRRYRMHMTNITSTSANIWQGIPKRFYSTVKKYEVQDTIPPNLFFVAPPSLAWIRHQPPGHPFTSLKITRSTYLLWILSYSPISSRKLLDSISYRRSLQSYSQPWLMNRQPPQLRRIPWLSKKWSSTGYLPLITLLLKRAFGGQSHQPSTGVKR